MTNPEALEFLRGFTDGQAGMGGHCMGPDQAEPFGERSFGPGECFVRPRPTAITGVADWD